MAYQAVLPALAWFMLIQRQDLKSTSVFPLYREEKSKLGRGSASVSALRFLEGASSSSLSLSLSEESESAESEAESEAESSSEVDYYS